MKIGFLDIPVSSRKHRINASDDTSKTPIYCHLELVEEEMPPRLRLELVNEVVSPSTSPDAAADVLN